MTKPEFMQALTYARRLWLEHWRGIDLFGTSRPRIPGQMSLRDILYHVAWYEREMVNVLQTCDFRGSAWWELTQDERNARIMEAGQAVSLLGAWRMEQQAYTELLAQLDQVGDAELEQAGFFKEMPADWKPWEVIASNTYEHYPQHFKDIV